MSPLTFRIDGSTWRFRLRTYFASLVRPRQLALVGLVALFPLAIERVVAFAMNDRGLNPDIFLAIGLLGAVLLCLLGAIVAVLRRVPPTTLYFDGESIREQVGDRTLEHTWAWILDATEDERAITLSCAAPMRSFRLTTTAARKLVVLPRDASTAALRSLLQARGKLQRQR
jgi:hypothetical protein